MREMFHSPTLGKISLGALIDNLCASIKDKTAEPYKIIIGADSTARDSSVITTVVIVQRIGKGCRYFYTHSEPKRYGSLADRIFAEAMSSITLAQEIRSILKDKFGDDVLRDHNEIHVDVGNNGPTRNLVDAVTGMLRGYNFVPVIKPDAFAAFAVADKHTK